jgi:hypothetical protein
VATALALRLEAPAHGVRLVAAGDARWSLLYRPHVPANIDVRLDDPLRRYVPRRLRIPVRTEADVIAAEQTGDSLLGARVWHPVLLPGATYPLVPTATAFRGRAVRNGAPDRWVRAEARIRGTNRVVGRAHGDERGEFLLIVGSDPSAPAALPDTVELRVRIDTATAPAPVVTGDPLADLPLQTLTAPSTTDPVSDGTELPSGYAEALSQDVDLTPGRIATAAITFDLS